METEWQLFADLADTADERTITVVVETDATVSDALAALLDDRPALRDRILTDAGDLREHINILRNGENVRGRGTAVAVEDGDELALFPPVSGGTERTN